MNARLTRVLAILMGGIFFCFQGCDQQLGTASSRSSELILTFTYGSEKEKWVEVITKTFNARQEQTASGKIIRVEAIPMGSGQCVEEVLQGQRETHLISPASSVFIDLGNAEAVASSGAPLVRSTESVCLSPIVIGMWKPMAEALGHGKHPIGWKEIHDLSLNPEGWGAYGLPQWGKFRFGHTHPDYSNSGMLSLIAEAYAGAGKVAGLTTADVRSEAVGNYIEKIEKAVVHYGSSTGFFGRKMFEGGPGYLSAAVMYENMVIESLERDDLSFPIVAVYPQEGTFWSDHPVGIIDRDYVTPDHRAAAQSYLSFLLARPQQELSMQYGFRPADPAIPLSSRFSPRNGVDPAQPLTTLEVPPVSTIEAIREVWEERKKRSHVILAIDTSGSMKGRKMAQAREGALQLLEMLDDEDSFSLITFDSQARSVMESVVLQDSREEVQQQIGVLFAKGKTALYDAIALGLNTVESVPADQQQDKITALVVLSDGEDSQKGTTLPALLNQLGQGDEGAKVRVFTIGYGEGASASDLKTISRHTQAKYYHGTVDTISEVFLSISTFF